MRALVIGTMALWLGAPPAASGQVGHDPARSPYRDVLAKQTVSFFGSYITGGRGDAQVAPTGGTLFGARWDVRLGTPTLAFLALSTGNLERTLVKPNEPPDVRFFGTASQSVTIFDGGFNLVLTGKKSWRGLAPFAGVGLGVAVGGSVPQDSSGFKFKTKFQVGPSLGIRWFLSQKVHFRVELKDMLWRVSYPDTFFEIADQPDLVTVLDPNVDGTAQWVHHATLHFSLGYTLKR